MRTLLLLSLAACTPAQSGLGPTPPPSTTADLAGSRCRDRHCECRPIDAAAEDEPPSVTHKRFELRIVTEPGVAWVTVDKEVVYKDTETGEACFYLDLPAGEHKVTFRTKALAKPHDGVGGSLSISEHNPAGPWWYDTFSVRCGLVKPCTKDELERWAAEMAALPRDLRDPCGSTKLKQATWDTGRERDGNPEEFSVGVTLKVYDFLPKRPPGDPACVRPEE